MLQPRSGPTNAGFDPGHSLFAILHKYWSIGIPNRMGYGICNVIYEKGPYCGTNIIGPDQTPRMMRGVWPGPTIFVANEHLKETFFLLPAQFW